MKINHVHAVYFSPTGNAKKVVTTLAQAIADTLGSLHFESSPIVRTP